MRVAAGRDFQSAVMGREYADGGYVIPREVVDRHGDRLIEQIRAGMTHTAKVYAAPVGSDPNGPGWTHLGDVSGPVKFQPDSLNRTRVTIEHDGPWEMTTRQMEELKGTAATMDVNYGDMEEIRSGSGMPISRYRTSEPVTRISNLTPAEAVSLLTTAFKGVGESVRRLGDVMRGGSITMQVQMDNTMSRGLFQMMTGGWQRPNNSWSASALTGGRKAECKLGATYGGRRGGRKLRAH